MSRKSQKERTAKKAELVEKMLKEGLNCAEIGRQLNLTRERIRQLSLLRGLKHLTCKKKRNKL